MAAKQDGAAPDRSRERLGQRTLPAGELAGLAVLVERDRTDPLLRVLSGSTEPRVVALTSLLTSSLS